MSETEVHEAFVNYCVESVGMVGLIASVVGIEPDKQSKLTHYGK